MSASCPFAPEPLDFVENRVLLVFAAGRLVRIGLVAETRQRGLSRLSEKYGAPGYAKKKRDWEQIGGAVPSDALVGWLLNGGELWLHSGKAPLIVYLSVADGELRKLGY